MKYKSFKTLVGVFLYLVLSNYSLIAQSVCPATDDFNTAGLNTYTVPMNAHQVTITLKGADGGNSAIDGTTGGSGATVGATFPVCAECTIKPGGTIDFILGGAGVSTTDRGGAGGGGASVAMVNGEAFPLLLAGGGGGASGGDGKGGASNKIDVSATETGGTQSSSGGGGSGAGSTEIDGTTHPAGDGYQANADTEDGGAPFTDIMTVPGGRGGIAASIAIIKGKTGGAGSGGAGGNGTSLKTGGGGGGGGYNGGNGGIGGVGGFGGSSYIWQGQLMDTETKTNGGDGAGSGSDGSATICFKTNDEFYTCDPTVEQLVNHDFKTYGNVPVGDKYIQSDAICLESWDNDGDSWNNYGGEGGVCTEAVMDGPSGTLSQTIATLCKSQEVKLCFNFRVTSAAGNNTDVRVKLGGLEYFVFNSTGTSNNIYSLGADVDSVTVDGPVGSIAPGQQMVGGTDYTVCLRDLNYNGLYPAKLEIIGVQSGATNNSIAVRDFVLHYDEIGAPQIDGNSEDLTSCVNTLDLTQIQPPIPEGLILTWKDSGGTEVTDPTSVPNGDYTACYTREVMNPECSDCDDEACTPITVGCKLDTDGDGILDEVEKGDDPNNPVDTDGDGVPDYLDLDSDNDGIPDSVEAGDTDIDSPPVDTDGDGVPDYLDLDADNDGINDIEESGGTDANGDGLVDGFTDADGDGLHDPIDDQVSPATDPNDEVSDGTPQNYGMDSDGTSGPDYLTIAPGGTDYTPSDSDGDGIPDSVDVDQAGGPDNNGDGIADAYQGGPDTDGDGINDANDPDIDGDGIVNEQDEMPESFGDSLPAPILLESFTVKGKDVDAILAWQTVMEENNSHFEVERSVDGRLFTLIGKVKGEGNSTVKQSYEYTDEGIGKTHRHLYYRLKQVDFDGKYDYTEVVAITFDGDERTIIIHPNPVSENLFLKVVGSGDVTIDLFDMHGKHILRTAKQTINITDYDNGAYYVRVFDGENHLIKSEKIIIIK